MILETERLRLSPFSIADIDRVRDLLHQPGVRKFLCDDEIFPREFVAEFQSQSDELFEDRGAGLWCAYEGETLIGLGGLREFFNPPVLEMMVAIDESRWRQGYGREISNAIIDRLKELDFDEVRASTDAPNDASIELMNAFGFRSAGESQPEHLEHPQLHYVLEL